VLDPISKSLEVRTGTLGWHASGFRFNFWSGQNFLVEVVANLSLHSKQFRVKN